MATKKKKESTEELEADIRILLSETDGEIEIMGKHKDVIALFTHALARSKSLRNLVADSLLTLTALEMEAQGIDFKKIFMEALEHHEQIHRNMGKYKKKAPQQSPKKETYNPRKPRRAD